MLTRPADSKLLAVALAALVMIVAGVLWSRHEAEPERWFMPGPLGHVKGQKDEEARGREVQPNNRREADELKGRRPGGGSEHGRDAHATTGFLTRSIGLRPGEEQAWGRSNHLTDGVPFSHHLAAVFPPELFEKHPEFFPWVEGKRLRPPPNSGFWNPDLGREDVARFAAEKAGSYFQVHPSAVSFALGVNDGLVFGESPETLALIEPQTWFRGRPDFSPLVFMFMNRAAAELAKTHPEKYLGCLAYYWCENAPPFSVDSHVIPFLTADRSQSYDPVFKQEEFELQKRWSAALRLRREVEGRGVELSAERRELMPKTDSPQKGMEEREVGRTRDGKAEEARKGGKSESRETDTADEAGKIGKSGNRKIADSVPGPAAGIDSSTSRLLDRPSRTPSPRLGLYDYLDGQGFLVPRVPIHAFAEHIKHAHAVGFTDYYGESSRNWGLDGPYPWVIAQLLSDPSRDVDALLSEYFRRYFEGAAEPMRQFFDRCEQQWMRQTGQSYWLKHYRNESQSIFFPTAVCAELRGLLDEAAARVARGPSRRPASPPSDRPFDQSTSRLPLVAERVQFVADSFGVTERFVAMDEARVALATLTLQGRLAGDSGVEALLEYLTRRSAFIRYTSQLTRQWPLAFYPINFPDWLRNDPAFAAAFALSFPTKRANALNTPSAAHTMEVLDRPEAGMRAARAAVAATRAGKVREVALNGSLEGALQPGRRIAGLPYGIDLPAPWQSKVEPTERHVGVVSRSAAHSGTQGVRISGAENTIMFQWVPATPGRVYAASVWVRGKISSSTVTTLTLGWLDKDQKNIGSALVMRLPDGVWPDWVQLRQGGRAPANAAWVGIGCVVQHQTGADWAEFDDFELREISADAASG